MVRLDGFFFSPFVKSNHGSKLCKEIKVLKSSICFHLFYEYLFNLFSLHTCLWWWWKIKGNLVWIILTSQQIPTLACTSTCGHFCVWVSFQWRHLCFPACFPQYTTLWCALISCYTLGAIVLSCCKLIYVPLTMFSARFNTPDRAGNSFWALVQLCFL